MQPHSSLQSFSLCQTSGQQHAAFDMSFCFQTSLCVDMHRLLGMLTYPRKSFPWHIHSRQHRQYKLFPPTCVPHCVTEIRVLPRSHMARMKCTFEKRTL